MSKVIVSLDDTPWKLIVYIALTFVCFLSCLGLNTSCDEFTVTDWSNSTSDVSSVEIHWNDGYTSDTEEEEKGRLIDEIHRDVYVQSTSSSTLSQSSTTSSSSCDFALKDDDNLTRLSCRLSFSTPSTSSNAGSLSRDVNLNDTSNRDLSLGAVLESGTSHKGIHITETCKDFEAAQSAMKHRQKKHIKSTVTGKHPPPCSVFVEGIPKDWNENQVKTACRELGMEPLHVHMVQKKGTGMLFSFQVAFLLFYPTFTFH